MNPDSPRAVVLGAGLAGLSAASRLVREGWRVTVLEAAPHVGGLAASFTLHTRWGEFDYDNGPHRFHTSDPYIEEEMLRVVGDDVVKAARQSRIYLYGRFFDYPLKGGNVLKNLPKPVLLKAFLDYFWVKARNLFRRPPDDNFENWVVNRFGRKLYDVFFGTYTEKTWGIPCTQISADWAAQRISLLSLWDTVKKTLFKPRNVPRTYVSEFHYPRRGGIGMLSRRYREEVEAAGGEVLVASPVTKVHREGDRVTGVEADTSEGPRTFDSDVVLGTIPVTTLARLVTPAAPGEVLEAASRLRHRSMVFVYLILDRPHLTRDHWIYLPEQSLITHRLSEFKNFSPDAAPSDKTLVCAEITCDYGDEDWRRSDEELRAIVARDLVRIGLIEEGEILHTFSRRERHAYPIYDLDYRRNKDLVVEYLSELEGLDTTGRQGLFKYNNMDHSVAMGLGAARHILGGDARHRKVATDQEYFG